MGATVGYEHAFHRVLERDLLRGWEVLNFGTGGYGADQSLLMWEARGARYRPDIAVLGFYHRDFFRNFMHFKGYLKPYFTLNATGMLDLHTEHLMPPGELVEEYESGRRKVGGWHYSQAFAATYHTLSQWQQIEEDDPDWKLMAAILRRFRDSAVDVGAQPFLLIIPEQRDRVEGKEFEDIDRLAIQEAQSLSMPVLSLKEFFHAEDDAVRPQPFFRADGHLTETGNCEMAHQLAIALEESGLVSRENSDTTTFRCADRPSARSPERRTDLAFDFSVH